LVRSSFRRLDHRRGRASRGAALARAEEVTRAAGHGRCRPGVARKARNSIRRKYGAARAVAPAALDRSCRARANSACRDLALGTWLEAPRADRPARGPTQLVRPRVQDCTI